MVGLIDDYASHNEAFFVADSVVVTRFFVSRVRLKQFTCRDPESQLVFCERNFIPISGYPQNLN